MSTPHGVAMGASRRVAQLGVVAALLLIALTMSTLILVPRYSRPVAVADVGTVAPDFQLRDVEGRTIALSELRGQAVVLFFGRALDRRSSEYNARMQQLAKEYADDARVRFFALNVTRPGEALPGLTDPAAAARTFPTLLDDLGSVATRYSAAQMPMCVVIDSRGLVRYRGPFDDNDDAAFVTHSFCPTALRDVLGAPTDAMAATPAGATLRPN
jgi:hypothetical protein